MKEQANWFSHAEWMLLMITLLGGFYMLHSKIERRDARTNQLYQMFVDLVKETRR